MMHHWNGAWGIGNWLLMGFGMLVLWTLVVGLVVWAVRSTGTRHTGPGWPPAPIGSGVPTRQAAGRPPATARDILDERYARGEIDDEDYRARRDALTTR